MKILIFELDNKLTGVLDTLNFLVTIWLLFSKLPINDDFPTLLLPAKQTCNVYAGNLLKFTLLISDPCQKYLSLSETLFKGPFTSPIYYAIAIFFYGVNRNHNRNCNKTAFQWDA